MKKFNKIVLMSGLLSLSSISFANDKYFSCHTSKGLVSLSLDSEKLAYEIKKPKGNAFLFSSPAPEFSGFLYNHYSRFQTDYMNVSFHQGGFKYTVFSNYEDGDSSKGVTVVNLKTKKEYTYGCNDEGVDRLSDLMDKLQCDKDDALGCQP